MIKLVLRGFLFGFGFVFFACESNTGSAATAVIKDSDTAIVKTGQLSGKFLCRLERINQTFEYDFTSAGKATLTYTDDRSHQSNEIEYQIVGNKFKYSVIILGIKYPNRDEIIEFSPPNFTLFEEENRYVGSGAGALSDRWVSETDTLTIVGDTVMTKVFVKPQYPYPSVTIPIKIASGKIYYRPSVGYSPNAWYLYETVKDSLYLYLGGGYSYVKSNP